MIYQITQEQRQSLLDVIDANSQDHGATCSTDEVGAMLQSLEPITKEPVAWWIPKAEHFSMARKDGSRPALKLWEPLYATPQPTERVDCPVMQKLLEQH